MALFQELNGNGITILLVTHEPDIARYSSRVITFRDGTLRSDTPVSPPANAKEILSGGLFESSENRGREGP
jgi:putative ABC transport system ATP-binding protein